MALEFRWQDAVTTTDPGAGNLNFNDADWTLTTEIVISEADRFGNNVNSWLDALDDSDSALKGQLRLEKTSDGAAWVEFAISAVALDSGFRTVTVAFVDQGASFDDNDEVAVSFARTGDKGDAGADGGDGDDGEDGTDGVTTATQFTFSTATGEDLDTGQARFNNTNPGIATYLFLDDLDRFGADVSDWIGLIDDAINPDYRSIVTLYKVADQSVFVAWKVTGDVETGAGIFRLPGELFAPSADPLALDDVIAIGVQHAPGKGDPGDPGDPGDDGDDGDPGTPFDPETLKGTSSTALLIGTGLKVFVTETDRVWQTGQRLRAASLDAAKVMEGAVSEYAAETGNLTLSVDLTLGSGTHNQWFISIAGERGLTGQTGDQGDQGEGLEFDASGTLAERDDYDDELRGFIFLETDITPNAIWVKATDDSGDWSGPTYIGGTPFAFGDWGSVSDPADVTYDLGTLS